MLSPVGVITGLRMRLVLRDAELAGTITSSAGSIDFVALVHATRMIAVIDLKTSDGEQKCRWDWHGGKAISSRKPIRNSGDQAEYEKKFGHPAKIWIDNPAAEQFGRGGVEVSLQKLHGGGAYAAGWKEIVSSGNHRTLLATCVMSYPGPECITEAITQVRRAARLKFEPLLGAGKESSRGALPTQMLVPKCSPRVYVASQS